MDNANTMASYGIDDLLVYVVISLRGGGKKGSVIKQDKADRMKHNRIAMKLALHELEAIVRTTPGLDDVQRAVFNFVKDVETGDGGAILAHLAKHDIAVLMKIVESGNNNNPEAKIMSIGKAVFANELLPSIVRLRS